jgi:hypothetical protein
MNNPIKSLDHQFKRLFAGHDSPIAAGSDLSQDVDASRSDRSGYCVRLPGGLSDRGLTIFEDAPDRRIKNDLPAGMSATPLRDDINRGVVQTDAFQ